MTTIIISQLSYKYYDQRTYMKLLHIRRDASKVRPNFYSFTTCITFFTAVPRGSWTSQTMNKSIKTAKKEERRRNSTKI